MAIYAYINILNFLDRSAQIREGGIQSTIRQQYLTAHQHKEAQTNIAVAMVTVAPVLVVLAGGYVMGVLVLVIERCVHGNILKCWLCGSVPCWP